MKRDDIVIRDKPRATEIKYRLTRISKIGDITILWGYRVKWGGEWISFGHERALREREYRLFTDDDFHYL